MNNNYQLQTLQNTPIVIRGSDVLERENNLAEISYALAEHTAFKDSLRAALSKQAMDNTAFLATAEEHYNKIAPHAREDLRFIVKVYARLAIAEIVGGEW